MALNSLLPALNVTLSNNFVLSVLKPFDHFNELHLIVELHPGGTFSRKEKTGIVSIAWFANLSFYSREGQQLKSTILCNNFLFFPLFRSSALRLKVEGEFLIRNL